MEKPGKMCKICEEGERSPLRYLGGFLFGGSCLKLIQAGVMLSDLLQDVSLFRILHQIDRDLAESCRQAGVRIAKVLFITLPIFVNRGAVPRKSPRNICIDSAFVVDGKAADERVLPPSCLFLDRRVYWQVVILVVMTLRQSRSNGIGANRLMRMFSIPRKTIVRWTSYFRDEFAASREWLRLRGRVDSSSRQWGFTR